MGLLDDIKNEAEGKNVKIQSSEERELEQKLNALFYLEKDIEKETEFVRMVMTRGQETQERKGLHASAIITPEKKFCYRAQILSLLYRQKQGENVPIGLKRIFEEGNAIHEKWQRLFIRGGYAEPEDCDRTRFNEQFELSYTPDIVATIEGERYVVEVKSVNTYQFKKMEHHSSGRIQLQLYMYLLGIEKGFTLCEDKNTQDFKVRLYKPEFERIQPYIHRLEEIQRGKEKVLNMGRIQRRREGCTSPGCELAVACSMCDVCWKKKKELL